MKKMKRALCLGMVIIMMMATVNMNVFAVETVGTCVHTNTTSVVISKATPEQSGLTGTKCMDCGMIYNEADIYKPTEMTINKAVYDGGESTPRIRIQDENGKSINAKHYDVTYKNNKKMGIATAIVTFKGDYYSGTLKKTFEIKPKAPRMISFSFGWGSKAAKIYTYDTKASANWTKVKGVSGYQIQWRTGIKKRYKKTVNVKGNKTKVEGIKVKIRVENGSRAFHMRVRAYKDVKINGKKKKVYSAWSDKW